ncbi:hypothetical protein ACLMJV_33300, partial [Sinorhizobium meliloti]|uniref:hypothetical protein n=1 Tax=Rhizobium meliloti TaxID=382 RepID=UPI00398CF091
MACTISPKRVARRSRVGVPSSAPSAMTSRRGHRSGPEVLVTLSDADIIRGHIGTNNLTTDKIETKVQFAPSFAFGLGFVLVFQPLALA